MSVKDDGGPAYPTSPVRIINGGTDPDFYHGMTLRDAFAIAALQGAVACFRDIDGVMDVKGRAEWAYRQADAMLKARSA